MSRVSAAVRIAAVIALFSLAACSGPPWTLSKSPNAIALRWYSNDTPSVAADEAAALHCRSWGKTAELASATKDGSADLATYRCR